MSIKALLFDLDDTLLFHRHGVQWPAVTTAQVRRICAVTPAFADVGPDALVSRFWEAFTSRFPEPEPPTPPFDESRWTEGPALLLEIASEVFPQVDIDLAGRWWHELAMVPPDVYGRFAFDDATTTLQTLQGRGMRMGLVTNRFTPAEYVEAELVAAGLDDVFTAVVTAGDVGFRKPDPRPFLSVLNQFDVLPSEAVMIGDSLDLDVRPALALGMQAVHRQHGQPVPIETVPGLRVIHRLSDLLDLPW